MVRSDEHATSDEHDMHEVAYDAVSVLLRG